MPDAEEVARYPLSAQLTMCCNNERDGFDMSKFIAPMALRIRGAVDSSALRSALDDVVSRHESLRTVLACGCEDDGTAYQSVLPPAPVPFTEHVLVPGPGETREDIAEELLVKLHAQTMPRTLTPLLRAELHRFDDRDAVLTILSSHLAVDAWSAGLLRRDLAACYRAHARGEAAELPPARQYGEYAAQQQAGLAGDKAREARDLWSARLAGGQVFAPAADQVGGAAPGAGAYGNAGFDLDPQVMDAVRAMARSVRSTPWHVLVAAGALLAARVTGVPDAALMTQTAARDDREFHDTVGFFADVLPLRVDLSGCVTYRDVLLRARGTCLDASRNPLPNRVLELDNPEFMRPRAQPENMLFLFNYARPAVADEDIQFAEHVEHVTMRQDVPLDRGGFCIWGMWDLPSGGLRGLFEYSPDRLKDSTAERWTADFAALVSHIATHPDRPWADGV
ncbi:condensation domain-containing protein [Streptomyces sp. V4-01]|uniref:Condensation domain-containing protein n=1 Tax=Actinacidiphila polyblastidii TaxID=3110430 RepID=A0ABU7PGY4_9ACTN|nr:condensation domain-containing protein [Streptomyces sp. V4-01]